MTAREMRREDRERFDELMDQKHYLGRSRPVGDYLCQIIERDGEWMALLAWGPAGLHLKDRDEWIGWNPLQRAERLKLVVQNRRYLLLTERGEEPNLASRALALAVRNLPGQWQRRFGYRPVLAESFTDIEKFHGTCYKASGWEPVGQSAGYSRHRADFFVPNDRPKRLWLKELVPGAKGLLCGAELEAEYRAAETAAASGVLPLNQIQMRSLLEAFREVPDPRAGNTRFKLPSVLALISMALLCGKRDISQFERFGWRLRQDQRAQLRLPLKKGGKKFREIPGYSVYYQLLARLDLDAFAQVLSRWLQARAGELPGALAMDGKMIRESIGVLTLADHDTGVPRAMAIISQKEGEGEKCEMVVGRRVIGELGDLTGRTVTADALHTQRKTARQAVEHGGEYLFQIKNNQEKILDHAVSAFANASPLLPSMRPNTEGWKAESCFSRRSSPLR